jgi:hypothetical protein
MNLLCIALVAAAFLVPRLLGRGGADEGFARSTTAALTGLGLLLLAALVALAQIVYTLRHRHTLARHERWLGALPLVLLLGAALLIVVLASDR